MFDFLRNAFALETGKDSLAGRQISDERQTEIIEVLARAVVERGLSAPAILFLESVKPMNFLGSQAMLFFEPIAKSVLPFRNYSELAVLLEDRNCIERLISEMERLAAQNSSPREQREKKR